MKMFDINVGHKLPLLAQSVTRHQYITEALVLVLKNYAWTY